LIAALLLGREGSMGFPGKNLHPVLGRPLSEYPLRAALAAKSIEETYLSTDSVALKDLARRLGAQVIDRPAALCTKEALGEDAYLHGYRHIKDVLKQDVELMVLLFCNAPCVLPSQIDEGVRILREHPDYDSAVTVSRYNMYSPVRARRMSPEGLLQPFIPFESYPQGMRINCDRDAQGEVYFADVCLSVVRPRCLENLHEGLLPQKWMGRRIAPIQNWGGLDVDYEWQLPQVEFWLRKNGFTQERAPY